MSAIYKNYMGSELEDVLVAGGVIADGSVHQALKGKHFKRGLHCLELMYEALIIYLGDKIEDNLEILRNVNFHKNLVLMHVRYLRRILT